MHTPWSLPLGVIRRSRQREGLLAPEADGDSIRDLILGIPVELASSLIPVLLAHEAGADRGHDSCLWRGLDAGHPHFEPRRC